MILLSFNITDSDLFLDNKLKIGPEKLLEVIKKNTERLLRVLEHHDVPATFFIASHLVPELEILTKEVYSKGHEIALYHNGNWGDTERAQQLVLKFIGKSAKGIRVFDHFLAKEISAHHFYYISPVEKMKLTYLFKRLSRNTAIYTDSEVEVIPESIAPVTQFPYNETIFQYLPMKYYENMVFETLKSSKYVLVYLNMLQFTDFSYHKIHIPFFRRYNTGLKMEEKLDGLLTWINDNDFATSTMKDFVM